jgi:hypothetical protein
VVERREGGVELVLRGLLKLALRVGWWNEFGKLEPNVNMDFSGSNPLNCSLTKVERWFTWNW